MFERSRQGAVQVLSGSAPLNKDHVPTAAGLFEQCLTQGLPRVVFNMEHVPLLDSVGLELLLEMRDRCRAQGGALRLAAPTRVCREILRATGLDRELEILDDTISAVGMFAQ